MSASMPIRTSPDLLGLYKGSFLLACQLALLAAVLLCIGASSAGASPSPTVLVLSVAEDGRQQEGLRSQVGELLRRAGARLDDAPALPAAARACEEPSCLHKLAEDHHVELVLAARIERRNRYERLIDMWLYEDKTGTDQSE